MVQKQTCSEQRFCEWKCQVDEREVGGDWPDWFKLTEGYSNSQSLFATVVSKTECTTCKTLKWFQDQKSKATVLADAKKSQEVFLKYSNVSQSIFLKYSKS